jgi:uncharacterized protein
LPGGLTALLDDIAVIARAASASLDDVSVMTRAAAASLDDVGVAAGRAGTKTAGVVIDDAAVTPSYVTGLHPSRELPLIGNIAKGSLKNKLVILLPGALLLSEFLPWAIIPILMLGGAYLSYEGAEKVIEKLGGEKHGKTLEDRIEDPVAFEKARTSGAIRTDLILSAEIMAITLSEVAAESFVTRALVLTLIAVAVTVVIYGAVALIVKMDDIGLHLAGKPSAAARTFGTGLVKAMPKLLTVLSVVGTVAMLWVGGGIVLHGLEELGLGGPAHLAHDIQRMAEGIGGGVAGWTTYAALSALFALALGAAIAFVLHKVLKAGQGGEAH